MPASAAPVYVTGAGGFLGRSVCLALAPHVPVVPVTRAEVDLAAPDVAQRLEGLIERLGAPAAVVHLAARKPGRHALARYVGDNVAATANLLDTCARLEVDRFVYASTLGVYAETRAALIDEAAPTFPHNGYVASKLAGEMLVRAHSRGSLRRRSLILRLPSLYGIGQRDSFVDGLARQMRDTPAIALRNRGQQVREILPVSDAVSAVCAAVRHYAWLEESATFNVAAGARVTSLEIASELARLLGYTGALVPADEHAPVFPNAPVSIEQARRQLHFEPLPWRTGLARYAEALRAAG